MYNLSFFKSYMYQFLFFIFMYVPFFLYSFYFNQQSNIYIYIYIYFDNIYIIITPTCFDKFVSSSGSSKLYFAEVTLFLYNENFIKH